MTHDTELNTMLVDLGEARAVTKGPAGTPIDEVQGFLGTGLADD